MACIAILLSILLGIFLLIQDTSHSFLMKNAIARPIHQLLKSHASLNHFVLNAFQPPQGRDFVLEHDPVFFFGKAQKPGNYGSSKYLLGAKGAHLAYMSKIGLSVPSGFTLTTEVCASYHELGTLPNSVWPQVLAGVKSIEAEMGRKFGDPARPLLVSVRSGTAISMPGMMDTIFNAGLNDETVAGLAEKFGEKFALDSYRRFLAMFGNVVLGIPSYDFELVLFAIKNKGGVMDDADLTPENLRLIISGFKEVYSKHGKEVLTDPYAQLYAAILAVLDSWDILGTAVNVQATVFGNMGPTSGTGICFNRNPNDGDPQLYGEYLINAQGEDMVAGIRTPQPISTLKDTFPGPYAELLKNVAMLEKHYHDMQDLEFTIQEGKLFVLQTRSGKRVGPPAVKIEVDNTVEEGLATKDQLNHPQFQSTEYKELCTQIDSLRKQIALISQQTPGQLQGSIKKRVTMCFEAIHALNQPVTIEKINLTQSSFPMFRQGRDIACLLQLDGEEVVEFDDLEDGRTYRAITKYEAYSRYY